ncbi:MAG: hypothetical protein ACOYOO_08155, partial [Saprospiraceae bacterium]
MKMTCRSEAYSVAEGGKRLFMALRAKSKFEADVFFMILRSEIVKTTCRSEEYSVAEGGKRLFMALRTKSKFEADVFFMIWR